MSTQLKKDEKAWKEYELSISDKGLISSFVGIGFVAAALGQIGQKQNRLLPFAVASAISFGLTIPFQKQATKHLKKSVKYYNESLLTKYGEKDSTNYIPRRIYYDNVTKKYSSNDRCFCLEYYLEKYPLAFSEYKLSKKSQTLPTILFLIGLSGIAAALGQIGEKDNRALQFGVISLVAFTTSTAIGNKQSKKHLEKAVNYYNSRL